MRIFIALFFVFAHIKGSVFSSGIDLGYEYRKPDNLYFGLYLKSSLVSHKFKAFYQGSEIESKGKDPFLGCLAIEAGYSAVYCHCLITPYFSLGEWLISCLDHSKQGFHEGLNYFGFGIKAEYGLNSKFDIGFDLQTFRTFHGWKRFKNSDFNNHTSFRTSGIYVGFPMRAHFGCPAQWDFQFEPYCLALSLGEKQFAYGSRLGIGYSL